MAWRVLSSLGVRRPIRSLLESLPVTAQHTRVLCLASGAIALAALLAAPVLPARAAESGAIDQKKQEQEAAASELERMKMDLGTQQSELVLLAKDIEKVRAEVAYAASQTVQYEGQLALAQDTLNMRAENLYRNPPDTLEMLLTTHSINDLVSRTEALVMLSERDAQLAVEVAELRRQSLDSQQQLDQKLAKLRDLRRLAEAQRASLEDQLASQRTKVSALRRDVAELVAASLRTFEGSDPQSGFDKNTVVSEANFRDYGSMSTSEIQGFLGRQPGTLAHYTAVDHNGKRKSVAQMISEASAAFRVSPKVILATLQKEQSLLSDPHPSQQAYDWAMGCGATDSGRHYQYQGFGKQIWWGAQKFDKNADDWRPGITKAIDGETVSPTNPGTFAQYRYTPHFPGVKSFWRLYWRYFGDPLAS